MRSFGHINPRYFVNRVKLAIDQKNFPNNPWLTSMSIDILDQALSKTDVGLEFGSGRSTLWFVDRLAKLYSVESDRKWFEKVKLDTATYAKEGRLDYRYCPELNYLDVLDDIEDGSIDFCLIDGIRRDECAVRSLAKIKNGGILVIDNIDRYLPNDTTNAPHALRTTDGPATPLWQDFLDQVEGWRSVWTSNGIFDTCIWFKPC